MKTTNRLARTIIGVFVATATAVMPAEAQVPGQCNASNATVGGIGELPRIVVSCLPTGAEADGSETAQIYSLPIDPDVLGLSASDTPPIAGPATPLDREWLPNMLNTITGPTPTSVRYANNTCDEFPGNFLRSDNYWRAGPHQARTEVYHGSVPGGPAGAAYGLDSYTEAANDGITLGERGESKSRVEYGFGFRILGEKFISVTVTQPVFWQGTLRAGSNSMAGVGWVPFIGDIFDDNVQSRSSAGYQVKTVWREEDAVFENLVKEDTIFGQDGVGGEAKDVRGSQTVVKTYGVRYGLKYTSSLALDALAADEPAVGANVSAHVAFTKRAFGDNSPGEVNTGVMRLKYNLKPGWFLASCGR